MAAQDEAPGRASVELAETELALSPGGPVDDQFEALLEEVMRPAVGAPPTCATGDRLGRYLLGRELGHGGFGVVFQARDVELNRDVAVKVLRPRAGPLGGLGIARLLREAKAMARLKHPNVVTVYEVGVSDHQPFLAMELVEGRSLRDWMRAGRRSWRQTLGVFAQAGRGLAAAHAAGLVHRDFKPDNVLVGDDRVVRVADFGLAGRSADHGLIAGGDEGPGEASADALSVAGAVAGTPLYMAPEQHRGEPPDGRTDQFSFCVALYEALHGEPPFAGRAPGDGGVAEPIGSVRPPARRNGVPRFVRAALLRGLRTAPSERFPSMDALLRAIAHEPRAPGAGARRRGGVARAPRRRRARRAGA